VGEGTASDESGKKGGLALNCANEASPLDGIARRCFLANE